MTDQSQQRPEILNNISETQMEEMERQFEEGDRQAWDALTNSYDWPKEESNRVWDWFGQNPSKGTR